MDNLWIIVAHRSGVSIFSRPYPKKNLELIQEIENPDGRLKDQEINADRPGRTITASGTLGGGPRKAGYSPPTSAHEHLTSVFAKEVADRIEEARNQNRFESLAIIAAPQFLGNLRKELSTQTHSKLNLSVDKNLGTLDANERLDHVKTILEDWDRKSVA